MRKLILILGFLMMTSPLFGAELLVRAKPHWMDSFTQSEVDKLSVAEKESYNARPQIGDIVVVRPDGWQWGKEECLPNFVIVKVPQITEIEAKKYEEPLLDTADLKNLKIIRHRKYALPKTDITTIKVDSTIFLTKAMLANKLITKIGLATEISPPKNDLASYLWRKIEQPLMIAYHYWIENAYAATQLKKTVMPVGGDYTSLSACMNANQQNLVTADKYFDVEIDGDWSGGADTTAVNLNAYTTDATRYINIYTTATARHKGLWSTSYYIISNTASFTLLTNTVAYITITGLQILNSASSTGYLGLWVYNANENKFCKNIIKVNAGYGVKVDNFSVTCYFYNNIIYTYGGEVSNCFRNEGTATVYLYNNTFFNGDYGVLRLGTGTITPINNIANGQATSCWYGTMTNPVDNISSDATSPNDEWDSKNVKFVNEGAGVEDLHLASDDTSGAIDGGTTDPGTGLFSDDIDGETRTGTWDIGADEYIGAPPARRVIMIM